MICLITLDRFIVIRYPFTQIRFRRISALLACGLAWAIGIAIAAYPLTVPHWKFYSQTSICLPLPVTRTPRTVAKKYAFVVMGILNFVLFMTIAAGQGAIFWSVRSSSKKSTRNTKSTDLILAYRLASIVVSDFLCWFPVGLLGLMSYRGFTIASEVNVALAILVLPLNSALNPFLYTLNTLMEKLQARRMAQLTKMIEARIKANMTNN